MVLIAVAFNAREQERTEEAITMVGEHLVDKITANWEGSRREQQTTKLDLFNLSFIKAQVNLKICDAG